MEVQTAVFTTVIYSRKETRKAGTAMVPAFFVQSRQ